MAFFEGGKSVFTTVVYVIGGALIIRFARSAYQRPDEYLAKWFTGYIVPPFRWTAARLRGFALFWMFAAVLMITSGTLIRIPPLRHLSPLLWVALCCVLTFFLIPRRPVSPRKHRSVT